MGKPNKPAAWFQAVKKAFRSPSKEKSDNKDDTKIHTGEKFGSSITASTLALLQEPTPLPLPSFGKMSLDEAEQQQQQQGRSNKKQPIGAVVEAAAMDAHVVVDNSSHEKEHKQESPSPAAAAAARDPETVTNGSNAKQCAVELLLNQEQDRSPSADTTVAKIEKDFAGPLALKGLVRLQALVRGHRVRRQAGTTLRAVEALVRLQARIRGRRVRMSKEWRAVQYKLSQRRQISSGANKDVSEEHWDASFTHSLEDGARKHERTVAHALPFSQQLKQNLSNPKSLFMDCESEQRHWVWSWLERWTAARPWENHYLNDDQKECCQTGSESSGKFCDAGIIKTEVESGGMAKAKKKKDGESNLQAGALNPQIRTTTTTKSLVQESLFKSIPFPLPTPPSATNPFSVPKLTPALVDAVHSPPIVHNQVDSQLLEPPSITPEGPSPPLKGSADSMPLRVASSPPAPIASINSLQAPFSPTAAAAPSSVQPAQLAPDLPGVLSLKEEEEEEEEEGDGEVNGTIAKEDGEANGLMCLESCDSVPLVDGYDQHEQQGGSTDGNRKSETNTLNDKAAGEENGENGTVPASFKSSSSTTTTSRYMTATESAKAKFCSLSNPKSRNPDEMEMRAKPPPQRRLSQGAGGGGGSAHLGKSNSQSSTSRNQHTNSCQTHASPKGRICNEKSEGESGTESPRRRDSHGGGETKPAIRWR